MHKKHVPFSKLLLVIDYMITLILIIAFLLAMKHNSEFVESNAAQYVITGYTPTHLPYDLTTLSTVLSIWVGQLGVSSYAYYAMAKSDHKIQLPSKMWNDLPEELKGSDVDKTTLLTTLLSTSDN